MATSPLRADSARDNRYQKFRANLLAPLSENAEQVGDRAFVRDMKADAKRRWYDGMCYVQRAYHAQDMLHWSLIITRLEGRDATVAKAEFKKAQHAYWNACDVQMRIPAPNRQAIVWKRRVLPFLGGHPDWLALVEADEARIPAGPSRKRKSVK